MPHSPSQPDLALRAHLDLPLDAAIERTTKALMAEGFGILTRIDVHSTLKQKLGVDMKPYVILGACSPALAHRALGQDLEIGLLLPCNIIAYEVDDGTEVAIMDPVTALSLAGNPALAPVGEEARAQLSRVAESLRA